MHINLSDIFLKKIKKNFSKLKKFQLLILGLSFKENTNDIRNSRVFELCEYLKKKGHGVSVYDPLVNNRIKSKNFRFYTDLKIKKKFHGILLAVPHKKIIKNIKLVEKLRLREAVFLDIKNIFGLSNKQMIKKLNIQSI